MGSNTTIGIRQLGAEDIPELLDWRMEVLGDVFAADRPWDAKALREANEKYYLENMGRSHVACVAVVDGKDAGCGALCLQRELPSPDNPSGVCAYIMNIYTRKPYRNMGVGRAVMEWLVDEAKGLGAEKVYLESTDRGAKLYSELGFKPIDGMMKLPEGLIREGS